MDSHAVTITDTLLVEGDDIDMVGDIVDECLAMGYELLTDDGWRVLLSYPP